MCGRRGMGAGRQCSVGSCATCRNPKGVVGFCKTYKSTEIQFKLIECRELLQGDFGTVIQKNIWHWRSQIQSSRVCFPREPGFRQAKNHTNLFSWIQFRSRAAYHNEAAVGRQADDQFGLPDPSLAGDDWKSSVTLFKYCASQREHGTRQIGFGLGIANFTTRFTNRSFICEARLVSILVMPLMAHLTFIPRRLGTNTPVYHFRAWSKLVYSFGSVGTMKKIQRFIFKLGRFPNIPSLSTPSQWPFTSIMGDM